MNSPEPGSEDDPNLFLDEDEAAANAAATHDPAPWRILIVDDDVDVHVVTKFALSTTHFQGRRLSFFHAYSAREALAKLRDTPDIALVLLDVIMETADAGLHFARQVREELHNDQVRIVLRTGQPGQALEHSIIVDYDINDFWSKADLTTRKLFTTVIAALRAYATLADSARARAGAMAELLRAQHLLAALDLHALVLSVDPKGRIVEANPHFCRLAGMTAEQLRGHDLHAVHPPPFPAALVHAITTALARDGNWAGQFDALLATGPARLQCTVMAVNDATGAPQKYLAVATPLALDS